MANATQTIAGDIQLAGDLAGNNNAASPALTNTTVTPGAYTLASITVDSKGRITAASDGSTSLAGDVAGPLNANVLQNTAVTPGSYTLANITVDGKGRLTAASTGTLSGDVTGPASATVLSNTAVTPGSYSAANITVDSKGRITSASNGGVSLLGDVTGATNATVLANTAVTPGSYTLANITVDSKGRITSASNGGLTLSGDVTGATNATVLANTAVTPGNYVAANITVDSKGRITAASNGASVPDATTTSKGVVQISTGLGLSVSAGVLSGVLANGTGTYGVVKSADTNNITITSGIIDVGTNIPKLNATNTFSRAIKNSLQALTSGTTISVDASLSNVYSLTLGTNGTLSNPTNLGPGKYTFIITQDGTGTRTLAYGTSYKFPSGADKVLGTGAGAVSVLTCTSNGTYLYCTLAKNFV